MSSEEKHGVIYHELAIVKTASSLSVCTYGSQTNKGHKAWQCLHWSVLTDMIHSTGFFEECCVFQCKDRNTGLMILLSSRSIALQKSICQQCLWGCQRLHSFSTFSCVKLKKKERNPASCNVLLDVFIQYTFYRPARNVVLFVFYWSYTEDVQDPVASQYVAILLTKKNNCTLQDGYVCAWLTGCFCHSSGANCRP